MSENLEMESKCKVGLKNRAVNGSSRHWPVIFLDMHNLSFAFAQWRLGLVRGEVKAKRKSRLGGEEGCWLVANS